MDTTTLDNIQKECMSVMNDFGYYAFENNKEFENSSVSALSQKFIPFLTK